MNDIKIAGDEGRASKSSHHMAHPGIANAERIVPAAQMFKDLRCTPLLNAWGETITRGKYISDGVSCVASHLVQNRRRGAQAGCGHRLERFYEDRIAEVWGQVRGSRDRPVEPIGTLSFRFRDPKGLPGSICVLYMKDNESNYGMWDAHRVYQCAEMVGAKDLSDLRFSFSSFTPRKYSPAVPCLPDLPTLIGTLMAFLEDELAFIVMGFNPTHIAEEDVHIAEEDVHIVEWVDKVGRRFCLHLT